MECFFPKKSSKPDSTKTIFGWIWGTDFKGVSDGKNAGSKTYITFISQTCLCKTYQMYLIHLLFGALVDGFCHVPLVLSCRGSCVWHRCGLRRQLNAWVEKVSAHIVMNLGVLCWNSYHPHHLLPPLSFYTFLVLASALALDSQNNPPPAPFQKFTRCF